VSITSLPSAQRFRSRLVHPVATGPFEIFFYREKQEATFRQCARNVFGISALDIRGYPKDAAVRK